LRRFADDLRTLRLLCGNPSYAVLRSGSARLPPATISDALSGRTTPRLEFVIAFVKGCLRYAHDHGLAVNGWQSDLAEWRRRWQRVRQDADATQQQAARHGHRARRPGLEGPATAPPPGPAHPAGGQPADGWDAPIPWQLPNAMPWLQGRDRELAWLDTALLGADPARPEPDIRPSAEARAASVVVLVGRGGVGKSALAVTWGHRHRAAFPDGQLFADLGGYGPGSPAEPAQVLSGFVRALGAMPQAIPSDLDGLAALFRSLCADRSMLIVLDNAADAQQVRPLLPAGAAVATLVTSRRSLTGLAARQGARQLVVRPLHDRDALALLQRDLPEAEPDDLRRLAAACGNLPLALRLASARLTSAPQDAELLGVEHPASSRLLTALTDTGDPHCDLPSVLSWSLSSSSPAESRALLLLSASPSATTDDHGAAALIGLPLAPARRLLSALADRHLLERRRDGSWWMHDLVRAWASRAAERTLGAVQVREAERRILGYQLWTADAMDRTLLPQRGRPALSSALPKPLSGPQFSQVAEALAWADAAFPAIVEGMSRALRSGDIHCAAVLPHIMLSYLNLRKPWPQWLALCRTGLAAAALLGDPSATANLHIAAGIAYRETHDLESATESLLSALESFRQVGNVTGVAMTLNNLATVYQEAGRAADARRALLRAAQALAGGDDPFRRAIVLHNLAEAELDLGELRDALHHARRALDGAVEVGDIVGAAVTRTTLGRIQAMAGRADLAEAEYRAALLVQRAEGDRLGQATTQRHLGQLLMAAGPPAQAAEQLREAATVLQELNDPAAGEAVRLLEQAELAV
jgi:tetratricopeptide (TPR) repeat protein